MSSENDVPLGDEARRYYERQFGERIRQVRKRGGTPPSPGGSKEDEYAGTALILGVICIITRIILFGASTDSSEPSYSSKPSPPPGFKADFQKEQAKR
jgi:hypothetical protein